MSRADTSDQHHADAKLIWDYHQLGHGLRPCSAEIGLGSHDLGVATLAAGLYRAGLFSVLVFSGGNGPTTAERFPRGEAVHYAEHAIALGVPQDAIIIEPRAANTGQNIDYSRQALADAGIPVISVMLISKPYMQRRAYATIRKAWPVGDLQRIIEYPARGFSIAQDVPDDVTGAYQRLVAAGYDSRLMKEAQPWQDCCAPSTSPASCPACPHSPSSRPPTSGSSSTTSSSPATTTNSLKDRNLGRVPPTTRPELYQLV